MKRVVKSPITLTLSLSLCHSSVCCFLCARLGYTWRDGQSAVYPGGNSLEDLLEVQPKSGWRCNISCVSANNSNFSSCFKNRRNVLVCRNMTIWCKMSLLNTLHACVWISHDESEKRLPKSCLVLLCKYEPVLRWSRDCDNSLYQGLVEILIPDVLRPIPSKELLQV